MPSHLFQTNQLLGTPGTSEEWDFYDAKVSGSRLVINAINVRLPDIAQQSDRDLSVFADTIELEGLLALPGRLVFLHARRIICGPGATIDVSGPNATDYMEHASDGTSKGDYGRDGSKGKRGGHAGGIAIFAGELSGQIKLLANGGRGGRGQSGGNGIKGGTPDAAEDGVDDGRNYKFPGSPGAQGLVGGHAGKGGDGGDGGTFGPISLNCAVKMDASLVTGSSTGGGPGVPGANGKPGDGGDGGLGGRGRSCVTRNRNKGETQVRICNFDGTRASSGLQGPAGPGPWDPAVGTPGMGFSEPPVPTQVGYDELAAYLSTYQVRMLQNRIAENYLSDKIGEVAQQLIWLERVTRNKPGAKLFSGNLKPEWKDAHTEEEDRPYPFYMYKYNLRVELLFQGQRPSDHYLPPSETEWEAIHIQTLLQLRQLSAGLDFYGQPTDYIPLVSYAFYKDSAKTFIDLAGRIEDAYKTYRNENADVQKRLAGLKSVVDDAQTSIRDIRSQVDNLLKEIEEHQSSIKQLLEWIIGQQNALVKADQDFQAAVQRNNNGKCNLATTLNVVFTILSVANSEGFSEVVPLLNTISGYSDTDLQKAVEKEGNHQNLQTTKYEVVKGNVEAIAKTWNQIYPSLSDSHDDHVKIVVTDDNFEKVLGAYLVLPEAVVYRDELRAYVAAANSRNKKIAELDALRTRRAQLEAQSVQLDGDIRKVSNLRQSESDPGLVEYKAFMTTVYQQTKWSLIKLLYQERRAWEYWALTRMKFEVVGQDVAALSSIHAKILSSELDVRNQRARPDQIRTDVRVTIRQAKATDEPKAIILPAAFADFKNSSSSNFGRLVFFIPKNHPSFKYDVAGITAKQVKVMLPGVHTADNQIKIRLIHAGNSSIDSPVRGKTFSFSHEIRKTDIEYPLEGNEGTRTRVDDNLGGKEGEYVYLSPFSTWTLIVDKDLNPGLDLSRVQEVEILFDIYFVQFA
jgi:peptidoglycan hydrolase CwlO-like protein